MEFIQPPTLLSPPTSLDEVPAHFAWLAEMRATHPVYHDTQTDRWHVFRYEDVSRVLTDYAVFSSESRGLQGERDQSPFAATMIGNDPPRHRQLRGLVSQAFTPRAIDALRPRITAITRELIDVVRTRGTMDVIHDLAYPLPVTVIAEMLGVPIERQADFKRWSDAIVSVQLTGASDADALARQQQFRTAMQEMFVYFSGLLVYRRQNPGGDLVSGLLTAQLDGQHLTEMELIGFCILLLVAGNETTTNLIGNAIYCLDAHPDAVAQVRQQPELMPNLIEEVLRYLPPVWDMARTVKTDAEIGGQHIPAGAPIVAWIVSANRDADQFPDPDRFDITRKPNRHLSFGHGVHTCIGAPLARLEASIALPMMLSQLPDLRRVPGEPVETIRSGIVFGAQHLPVTFTALATST